MDSKRGQVNPYEHTLLLTETRRTLFPSDTTDSEEDSDLGHISPLSFDSNAEQGNLKQFISAFKTDPISNYDIIEVVQNDENTVYTPSNNKHLQIESMSPLYLSPYKQSSCIINETPPKTSPSFKLKTPHDTCSTNCKAPKLVRKSLLDSEQPPNKHKLSPYSSSKTKLIKLDNKSSKVRTTLFPEDISLPTKSFYPKSASIVEMMEKRKFVPKTVVQNTTSRKPRGPRIIGQINAGVSHKIRKPKQKINKVTIVKAAMNSVENTALTNYIKDLRELKANNKEQIKHIENKENNCSDLHKTKLITSAKYLEKSISRKRLLSSTSEPNQKNKFFKSSRQKEVTTNKTSDVEVDQGKMLDQNEKYDSTIQFDPHDFTLEDPSMVSINIDNILSCLKPDTDLPENPIVLEAHKSVLASESSILLHDEPVDRCGSLILSPISQMCDVTSGLDINSPKRVKNLNSVLGNMATSSDKKTKILKQDNYFPIFHHGSRCIEENNSSKIINNVKKFKKIDNNQMLLDAGQKKFGVTQCVECNFVYHIGDPSDEKMHWEYHKAGNVLKFYGWKNERVVANFGNNGRIIQIMSDDPKSWIRKVVDLMDLINRELGCYEIEFDISDCQIYLYIQNRSIVGCTVAVSKSSGHKMLTTNQNEADLCSETTYPIKCGISRIWVSRNHRKQGIGTAMMNTVKKNFLFGGVLENSDIAVSSPTEFGKAFARSYFKTPNYLVYVV